MFVLNINRYLFCCVACNLVTSNLIYFMSMIRVDMCHGAQVPYKKEEEYVSWYDSTMGGIYIGNPGTFKLLKIYNKDYCCVQRANTIYLLLMTSHYIKKFFVRCAHTAHCVLICLLR